MEHIFYIGWESLARTLIIGVLAYVTLIVFLRVAGKRTLSKMNAFDFIVTIALGSTLASVILSKDVALADGALAFGLLIALQFVLTWTSVRVRWVRQLATGEPTLLLHRGEFLTAAMVRSRVTESEIRAAVRAAGVADMGGVEAVVLETDGSFSVLPKAAPAGGASSLADVQRVGSAS